MQSALHIKQFELFEKDALLSFLRIAYPDDPRQSDQRFWEWHYLESPYVAPDNMPIWIAKDAEEIVGQMAAIPVELKIGEVQRRAIWILDFVVRPDYRRRGLGKRLVLAAEESCPVRLGIATDAQHSPAILKSLGWAMLGKIPRYNRLLFPGNAIREISRFKTLRRLANVAYAPLRPRLNKRSSTHSRALRVVEQFDSTFDALWREASVQWPCAVVRDSSMLRWQYTQQPGKKFEALGLYEKERLVGYVVLFVRKHDAHGALPKAAITDLCYHPDRPLEIIDELLQGALQLAIERRVGALVTDVTDPLLGERLQRFGFWRTKNPQQFMVKSADHQDLLYHSSNWFLTRGDSDTSIFEQSNL
ncbi:MAG TPA: GNAT family N-acetyltransferase [Pyrinomonadaceae bacterium]|jgi:GNAT superfamily N-acetyltransferase|nr:GNAT family N-acetyltransferase [Pyrinomonadaceae bacterium]